MKRSMKKALTLKAARAFWNYDPYCGLFWEEMVAELKKQTLAEIVAGLEMVIAEDESGETEELEAVLKEIKAVA